MPEGLFTMPVREMADRVSRFLADAPVVIFVPIMVVFEYVVSAPVIILEKYMTVPGGLVVRGPDLRALGLIKALFTACFVAPLLETLIFQCLIIIVLEVYVTKLKYVAILVSAICFAASHSYSLAYMIRMLPAGLVLASAFVLRDRPKGYPYSSVVLLHASWNALAVWAVFGRAPTP